MDTPVTLGIDCGGTGIKAALVSADGQLVSDRLRVPTPYPLSPERFLDVIAELVAPLSGYDRVSAGVPGVVRHGLVVHTPHFVTMAGPFTAKDPELVQAWAGFDAGGALAERLGCPARVVNDAEMQGSAVIGGLGFEVVLTFGTGMGFAMFDNATLLPKVEMSAHPLRKRQSYDERLGEYMRREIGNARWSRRVAGAIATLRPVFAWDRLYVGGGNARHLSGAALASLSEGEHVVDNIAGLLGAPALWR